MWYETDRKELVLGQMLCLETNEKAPRLGKCHEMGASQEWHHKGTVSCFSKYIFIRLKYMN